MKRSILLLMFLAGCAEGGANYDVRIGSLDPAQCTGYMHLEGDSGDWRCELIGGEAHMDTSTPGVLFLNLETTPGMLNQVRAVRDGTTISGQIFLDGSATAFFATEQAQ